MYNDRYVHAGQNSTCSNLCQIESSRNSNPLDKIWFVSQSVSIPTAAEDVPALQRRFLEQNTPGSQVPEKTKGTGAVTAHETLAYQQLPCICSYVPEISNGMNTNNIGG